ncbi:MAG: ATP-binding protein, partial [Fibromonadales bacterium]|nr:ATP-binding protein [Fibromonadales bacterium]
MGIMKSFFSGSRRNGAIDALNKAVEIFTSHTEKTFEDVMSNGICPIANAVEVDRVIVYCRLKANREMFGQVYRWDKQAGGTVPLDENLKVLPPIPAVMQWLALSLKGESIVRRLDKMSKEEMNFANAFGIKSIALLPIYTYGECWGAIAFQDHTRQRDFDDCIDLLYSAARLYANAIIRHDITLEANRAIEIMERQKKMADVLNKSAVMFVSQNKETFDEKMTAGLELICGMAKVSRLSIWRNHVLPDGLRCSQVYCWDKETGSGSSDPKLANLSYAKFAPEWEELLKHGNIINGPVKILPGSDLFKYNSALSALVVPLFIENSFWGFMLFEDQSHERLFDDDYVEIMRSTAFLCASVLIKTEMEHIITEANELNNTLINSAPISIIIFDENAHIIDCNDTTLKMFNCEKQYFQKHFFDLSTEYQVGGLKSRDKAMVFVRRALKGETVTFEWMHSSKSGELIPSEVTLIRVNYSGKTVGLGYIYDLRNIKKMEVIIGEAQEKAHSIAEASPFSYILFDEDQQAIDCNEAALQIFGCEDKQYFLDNYLTLFSPEIQPNGQKSVETIKAILTKALNEKKTSYEWFHQTIDGELLPMENTLTPLKFKDSKYVISFKYDLRPRKKLMDEINRQNQQLTFRLEQQQLISEISKNFISGGDLYALINDALGKLGKNLDVSRMFVFHMDYECLDCHAIYQWYRDCSAPKVKRGPDFDIFSLISAIFPEGWPEGKAVSMVSCADVSASKDEKICELKTYDVMSFLCSPIYVDGHLWGILSAEHCFAPHGWTDDETSFFVMASSIISGAIMRSIYDIRLKESLNKVTSLSKAKDNFLSKISHEIRTPMNSILGITEVQLRNESLPYSTREALGIIYHSGDSLLRIINDLLDLSKIEEKELEITPAKYEIASLISDSVQLNMLQVESKPIEFKLDVDENTPLRFFGDALRIKQILNNVLSNAFKYTDKGRVSMSVSMEKNEGNYDVTLVFCISDTGQGMTEEQVNMLFASEYSRFDMVSNRLIEGSGLGTAIVRHLLSIMDGDISVKSELGKGSSFTIRIPQKTAGPEVLGQELAENLRKFRARNYLQIEKSQIIYDPMPHGKILIVD